MTPSIDIVLESIRAVLTGFTLLFLLMRPNVEFIKHNRGWRFFITGFGLIFLGTLVDITDNFESLDHFIVLGNTPYQAFIEKFIGFFLGFLFLALGVWLGIPAIIENDRRHRRWIEINDEKLKTQKATMRTVMDIVGNAFQEIQMLMLKENREERLAGDSMGKINDVIYDTSDRLTDIANLETTSEKKLSNDMSILDLDAARREGKFLR